MQSFATVLPCAVYLEARSLWRSWRFRQTAPNDFSVHRCRNRSRTMSGFRAGRTEHITRIESYGRAPASYRKRDRPTTTVFAAARGNPCELSILSRYHKARRYSRVSAMIDKIFFLFYN